MTDQQPRLSPSTLRRVRASVLPPAVVLGTDINGLSLARALTRHGVPVLGVDSRRRRYASYSGAFDLLLVPAFHGPSFLSFLEALPSMLERRPALFVTMDEHVKLIGMHGQQLRSLYHLEYPTPDAVELLMNKQRFTELAQTQGWSVPATVTCTTEAELREAAASLAFPVVMKPRIKNREFRLHSPAKAFRCSHPDELLASYARFQQWEPEVVIQEWIPGGDGDIHFSFHYLDGSLREVCRFEGRKIRQWLPECGSTASATGVADPVVGDLSLRILQETGCVGFGSVEYKRDPRTGRFFIMEPTVGRTNLQVGTAIANGVDIVSRAYFHLIGRPYPGSEKPAHDRKWIILGSDLRSARHYIARGQLTWGGYLRSLSGPRSYAVWRATDYRMMAGFVKVCAGAPGRLLLRVLSRLRSGGAPAALTGARDG